jgi:DNA mismatch repair protein MutS
VDDAGDDVTFLRTIREGSTDRSYGVHVAELAGVPDPVVSRSRDVLDRLREERAIEARGGSRSGSGSGTQQVVFDVGSGQLRTATTDGGDGDETERESESESGDGEPDDALDPETAAVIEELSETELANVSPVELMGRVRDWQGRLPE